LATEDDRFFGDRDDGAIDAGCAESYISGIVRACWVMPGVTGLLTKRWKLVSPDSGQSMN